MGRHSEEGCGLSGLLQDRSLVRADAVQGLRHSELHLSPADLFSMHPSVQPIPSAYEVLKILARNGKVGKIAQLAPGLSCEHQDLSLDHWLSCKG